MKTKAITQRLVGFRLSFALVILQIIFITGVEGTIPADAQEKTTEMHSNHLIDSG